MPGKKDIAPAGGEAFAKALYDEYKQDLQSYVRKRLPAAAVAQAEDIVQETFAQTIKYLNNGKAVKSPKAFLYTTARNVITSTVYRRRVHMETDATDDMDRYTAEPDSCSPQRHAAAQQHLDSLAAAISGLPDNYREAFVRRRINGESCREIAQAMNIDEHKVSTYAALGWQLLAEYCKAHNIALENLFDL